jgi:hypothetical protein
VPNNRAILSSSMLKGPVCKSACHRSEPSLRIGALRVISRKTPLPQQALPPGPRARIPMQLGVSGLATHCWRTRSNSSRRTQYIQRRDILCMMRLSCLVYDTLCRDRWPSAEVRLAFHRFTSTAPNGIDGPHGRQRFFCIRHSVT